MDRWEGKIALVTGASAGIGAAIAESLIKHGLTVIGLARRVELVEELKAKLTGTKGQLYPRKGDVSSTDDVDETFKWIQQTFGTIHVLVNNAGITRGSNITDGKFEHFQEVVNVNFLGLVNMTQKTLQLMKAAGVNDGHIININSVTGHTVPQFEVPAFNVYPASKYAVTAFTETLRQELNYYQLKTKITSISPGIVETEMVSVFHQETAAAIPSELLKDPEEIPYLKPEDIADAVIYVLSTPLHVQVHELMIRPVGETF